MSRTTMQPDWRDYPPKEEMSDAALNGQLIAQAATTPQTYCSPLMRYTHAYRLETGECGIAYRRDDGQVAFSPYWFFPADATSGRVFLGPADAFRLGPHCTREGREVRA